MTNKIYLVKDNPDNILDLQNDFTVQEIGMYFILKAAYFKYGGDLKEENLHKRCNFFENKEELMDFAKKIFIFKDKKLINNIWLSEIKDINEKSKKRKEASIKRWSKEKQKKQENSSAINDEICQTSEKPKKRKFQQKNLILKKKSLKIIINPRKIQEKQEKQEKPTKIFGNILRKVFRF